MKRKRLRSLVRFGLTAWSLALAALSAIGPNKSAVADEMASSLALKLFVTEAVLGAHDLPDWDKRPLYHLRGGKIRLAFMMPPDQSNKQAIDPLLGIFQVQANALNVANNNEVMSLETSQALDEDVLSRSRLLIYIGGESEYQRYLDFIDYAKSQPVAIADDYYPLGRVDTDPADGCAKVFFLGEEEIVGGAVYIRADNNSFSDRLKRIAESSCLSDAILGAFGFRGYAYSLPNCDSARCDKSPSPVMTPTDMQVITLLYAPKNARKKRPDEILRSIGTDLP